MSRPAYIFNERGAPVIYISNSDPVGSFTMSALGRASVYMGVLLLPSLGKGATRWLVSDYERTAIRPHVFQKF